MQMRSLNVRPRSLSNRLVLNAVALTVVLVIGVSLATLFTCRHFLENRLDDQLAGDAGNGHAGFYFSPNFIPQDEHSTGDDAVSAVAFDSQGHTESPTVGLATRMAVSAATLERFTGAAGGPPISVTTTAGEQLRVQVVHVADVPMRSGGSDSVDVAIGLSTADLSSTVHKLIDAELIIGSIAIAVAFAATTYGVRRNMRGLQSVTQVAWDVAGDVSPDGSGLTRRVPMDDENVSSEVGQLAFSMNTLLTAVETQVDQRARSEQRMRQFLLDASHELRTPLTSIRGFAELARMHREAGDGGSAVLTEIGDNLNRIESEGVRMSRLVDDLLSLARSDEGVGAQLQFVEIDELARDVAASGRAAFSDRPIDVDAAPGLVVRGDPDQLRRVLTNLVTNAAVHTRPGGPIRIAAHRSSEGGVTVQVSDSGPGLADDDAAHVFDRFWRADKSRTRASGGSGLGLSIVAAIAATHGAAVAFDSSIEAGSTVTLHLPPPSPEEDVRR